VYRDTTFTKETPQLQFSRDFYSIKLYS